MIPGKRRADQKRQNGSVAPEIAMMLAGGIEQNRAGLLEQARETYRFVLTMVPEQADALHLLGVTFLDEQPSQAEALIRQAIAQDPRNPLYYSNLARVLRKQRKFEEALAMCDKALRRQRDFREAHVNRGLTLLSLHRREEAVAAFGAALALKPDFAAALKHRADTLSDLGRHEAAVADYDRLLAIEANDVVALNNRGLALLALKRPETALADYEAALALAPDSAEIVNGQGCALKATGRPDEALACFSRAVSLRPDYVEALVNRGSALFDLGRFDESISVYAEAQQLNPHYAPAHWNEAISRLVTGDLPRGFAKAEWRFNMPSLGLAKPAFAQPLWLGKTPLDGKTILVHADMGFGDTIQFARYIPMLAQRGARVVAMVQKSTRTLIAAMDGVSLCIARDDPLPAFDVHCPLGSLPLAFGTTLDSIPAQTPYLSANDIPKPLRDRLEDNGKPKIGIVWSGNADHGNDRNRSIPLGMLQSLFDCDATFFSLQTELRAGDAEALRGRSNMVMAGQHFADFADTAALVAALDLVITVDTSAAHLAGALGRPVWIVLPLIPDWRWLLDREDSPWYPTARLFRQGADRRWEPVIERMRQLLERPA